MPGTIISNNFFLELRMEKTYGEGITANSSNALANVFATGTFTSYFFLSPIGDCDLPLFLSAYVVGGANSCALIMPNISSFNIAGVGIVLKSSGGATERCDC